MLTPLEQKLINKANTEFTTVVVGSKIYRGRADRRKLYPNAIGIDMLEGEGVDTVVNIVSFFDMSEFSYYHEVSHIDCHSVLEHCQDPLNAADNLESILLMDGTIFLSVPFVWREHAYPNDYFRFTKEAVKQMFPRIEWESMFYVSGGKKVKKPPCIIQEGVPYFARTELYAFGRKV